MEAFRSHYDVAVVGAGPTGCVTAIAHARRGARVLLLEASPSACCRFAGEWLHPPGAAVLGRLGITPLEHAARHEACRGFVVFPDDGSDAVVLPYANHALGISAEHELLVDELRCHVQAESGIDYRPYCRVEAVQAPRLKVVTRTPRRSHEVQACRIVGAEGRNSVVRQSLGLSSDSQVMSYMAGVDLLDVEMPFEGYGHVIVGAPGPMLLYRVGPRLVRACIDLPAPYAHLRRDLHKVWDVFGPHLPSSLQEPFRQALQVRQVAWAASRFRPRACYGLGEVAMVGDAVGHFHPLTASGMTIGFLDAETLARSPDVASYAREREGKTYVSELLASALYQVVIHTDETAGAIRQAIYSTWRQSQAERERTMRILAGEETRPWAFGAAFARVAGQALVEGVDDAHLRAQQPQPAQSRWPAPALQAALGGAQRARDLWAWSHWPLASLLPRSVRTRCRPGSLPHNPLGARLGRWLPGPTQDAASQVADVVGCASAVLSASAARSQHEVLAQSLEQRCVLLAQDARRDATT
ncbi:MAG: FAD-dependent monooxygenase, partial [Polyangiales bacterium]